MANDYPEVNFEEAFPDRSSRNNRDVDYRLFYIVVAALVLIGWVFLALIIGDSFGFKGFEGSSPDVDFEKAGNPSEISPF